MRNYRSVALRGWMSMFAWNDWMASMEKLLIRFHYQFQLAAGFLPNLMRNRARDPDPAVMG